MIRIILLMGLLSQVVVAQETDFSSIETNWRVCASCHGNKGDGKGNLVKREKILGIPSYDDVGRAINEGSIYHTIYYGKNAKFKRQGRCLCFCSTI